MGMEWEGEIYNDDRMFVMNISKCSVMRMEGGITVTTTPSSDPQTRKWALTTYRNTERYPPYRVDHFGSYEDALKYLKEAEPTTPLISLGGKSPEIPMPYEEYVEWKSRNGFEEFDLNRVVRRSLFGH